MAEPYLGEIRAVGFTFAPVGWLSCNGQLMQIAEYDALFALIGTTYGGDGQTTFALPDLQGRVGVGAMAQGPGLSSYSLGQKQGTENVTLLATQLPLHSHPYSASVAATTTGGSNDPAGRFPGAATKNMYANAPTAGVTMAAGALTGTSGAAGGSQPHTNLQPTLGLNYIIAVQGIFPSRN
jgi:microcystin-dependent protein